MNISKGYSYLINAIHDKIMLNGKSDIIHGLWHVSYEVASWKNCENVQDIMRSVHGFVGTL